MVFTAQKFSVFGKKVIVSPIERESDMLAAVQIGVKSILKANDKTFIRFSPVFEFEFPRATVGEFFFIS